MCLGPDPAHEIANSPDNVFMENMHSNSYWLEKFASREVCHFTVNCRQITLLSVTVALLSVLLEEAPRQQRGEAVKHTGGQVEDGAETRLQSGGTTSVDHHHLVDLFRKLVGQEGTERHTRQ